MLAWFEKNAAIRTKFRTLLLAYSLVGAVGAAAGSYAACQAAGVNAPLIIGIEVASVAILAGLTAIASRLICTPYVTTVVRMEALAAGDLDSPIAYTENRDCVGRMTVAMAIFRKSMQEVEAAKRNSVVQHELGAGLNRLANGDLTHRIETVFPAEYEALRRDFNIAMDQLSAVMGAVTQAGNAVHNGANEISQASNDLSRRTEQQAASLEETAAAMDQITTTVREAAESVARANEAVQQARHEAEYSGGVVGRAIQAMGGIEQASAEISEIISVIDGIAFQTNLLALNAGVEAARAGDAGKGFAVVASEVRALAQRSAEAAKDVKERINGSSQQVDAGVSLVRETGAALQRIISSVGELDGLVSGIASSAKQQANGLQQVNSAVAAMDGVTQQNAAMVEQATAASRSLAAEADSLAQQISGFKVAGGAIASRSRANPVRALPARASGARQRPAPRTVGNAAVALSEDDWSEF